MIEIPDIRNIFVEKLKNEHFRIDKSGVKTLEIIGASFFAEEQVIFGEVDVDYVGREIKWYRSESRNVNDITGKIPEIWKSVADQYGNINSNYGWCIYSNENHKQFDHVVSELVKNSDSRRAIMIYTRPEMWNDYNKNGMNDFMCTNTVQYFSRNNVINAVVSMRSNDAVFGYKNDYAWQEFVLYELCNVLTNETGEEYEPGSILWQAGSLHIYERHFHLVDHYAKTGKLHITKKEYDEIYNSFL